MCTSVIVSQTFLNRINTPNIIEYSPKPWELKFQFYTAEVKNPTLNANLNQFHVTYYLTTLFTKICLNVSQRQFVLPSYRFISDYTNSSSQIYFSFMPIDKTDLPPLTIAVSLPSEQMMARSSFLCKNRPDVSLLLGTNISIILLIPQ